MDSKARLIRLVRLTRVVAEAERIKSAALDEFEWVFADLVNDALALPRPSRDLEEIRKSVEEAADNLRKAIGRHV